MTPRAACSSTRTAAPTPGEGHGSRRGERSPELGQQPGRGDGQVADTAAGRVVDGVGDGGGGAHDADLTDTLGAHRVQVRVVLLHPDGLDVLNVGAGGDVVLRQVVVEE